MPIYGMILLLILGLIILVVGANFFVDGASGLAKKMKISDMVIGMTVVAFGTSAPELAVSIKSAISGSGDVLMGNIVGSNIMNIMLILGVSALICKLPSQKRTLTMELPFLVLVTAVFAVFATVGGQEFARWEGGVLLGLFAVYLGYMIVCAIKDRKKAAVLDGGTLATVEENKPQKQKSGLLGVYQRLQGNTLFLIVITLAGLAGVVFGAEFIVTNVERLSELIPSENARKILSVTVVALGTSLPELVTSVAAAIKGNSDLALGNVIGSNIMNIILIGGLPIAIFGVTYTSPYLVDMLVSIAATVLLFCTFFFTKEKSLNKIGGIILLTALAGYLTYLFIV